MSARLRVPLGFIVAPLIPGVLVDIAINVMAFPAFLAPFATAFAAMMGYPVALLLGVPSYLALRWLGWVALFAYAAAGAFLGLSLFAFYFIPPALDCLAIADSKSHECLVLSTLAPFGVYSALAGITASISFWLITRPDRAQTSG